MPSDEKYYKGVKNVDTVAQFSDLTCPNPITYSYLIFLPSANRVARKKMCKNEQLIGKMNNVCQSANEHFRRMKISAMYSEMKN